MRGTYSKLEAQALLLTGNKIKHRYFTEDEFVYINQVTGELTDENGNILNEDEFWALRTADHFDFGWEII